MQCLQQAQWLPGYLDSALTPSEEGQFQAHTLWCMQCAEELEVQRTLVELLDDLPRHPAPRDFAAQVLAALPEPRTAVPRRPLWTGFVGLAVAALAVTSGIGLWSAPAGSFSAVLGRLATGWYAWCVDLRGTLAWLQWTSPAELQSVAGSLGKAAQVMAVAMAAQLVFCWAATLGLGLGLREFGRVRRQPLPS